MRPGGGAVRVRHGAVPLSSRARARLVDWFVLLLAVFVLFEVIDPGTPDVRPRPAVIRQIHTGPPVGVGVKGPSVGVGVNP
ncbi:MAG: hypothetical protein QOF83_2766 [Solirubrobacteraceae bacterium]|nr:hypothetical protein [Solirubrobacteraceae bacterium]